MTFAKCDGDSWTEVGAGKIDGMCPTASGEIPCQFAGLWWMDGNPAPDYVASFGKSNWRSKGLDGPNCRIDRSSTSTNGDEVCACSSEYLSPVFNNDIKVPCLGRMMIPFAKGGRVWSWHDNLMGKGLSYVSYMANATYIFECGGPSVRNITMCLISMADTGDLQNWWPTPPARRRREELDTLKPVLKDMFVPFGMTLKDEHQWNRNSQLLLWDYVYWLKRVTTCDGSHDSVNWDAYMSRGTAKVVSNGTGIYGNPASVDTRAHVGYVAPTQMVVY